MRANNSSREGYVCYLARSPHALHLRAQIAWCLAGYEGNKIVLKAKGTGGRTECLAAIPDNTAVLFGAFKLMAVDNRGTTVSARPKYVVVFYRAENAPSMQKAKAGRHMGAIEQCFHGHHVVLAVDELHELSEAEVVKKLRTCGGAHQPTGYDFGHGDVGEGSSELAPTKVAGVNPADVAPQHAKAPKPHEEGALRAQAYMNPAAAGAAAKVATEIAAAAEAPAAPATPLLAVPAAPVPAAAAAAAPSEPPATAADAAAAGMASLSVSGGKPSTSGNGRCVVMLVTSMPSTTVIEGNQVTLRNVLGRLATGVTELDGTYAMASRRA